MWKILLWAAVLAVAGIITWNIYLNWETRAVRHAASRVAGNVELALSSSLMGVLNDGNPVNVGGPLLQESTGNPFNRKEPAYVFGREPVSCGQVWMSEAVVPRETDTLRIRVPLTSCTKTQAKYLREALSHIGGAVLTSSLGLAVSGRNLPRHSSLASTDKEHSGWLSFLKSTL